MQPLQVQQHLWQKNKEIEVIRETRSPWESDPALSRAHPSILSSLNPLAPESDQHLISPYNISPESNMKVMRIEEMITD